MKIVITYGTYDLLHHGHIALLQRAKDLGDYLIVGVTADAFDKNRGKLNVQQSLVERIEGIRKTGLADKIIVEEYEGQKIADIKKYGVDIFAIGSDWTGKFDYLKDYCKVVYLQRTDGISSTELRENINPVVKMGIVGIDNPAFRVWAESMFVGGLDIVGIYDEVPHQSLKPYEERGLKVYESLEEMLSEVQAVYIAKNIYLHEDLIMKALEADCHVLCESPIFLSKEVAKRAFALAKEKDLVLFEAIKTLFFPAFEHLLLLVDSGMIGEVKDIDVSCSVIPDNKDELKKYEGSMFDWGSVALAPIIKLLGPEYEACKMYSYGKGETSHFAKGILQYKGATASFKMGKGIKTEGQMIVTGTKGYIYVPAPWWKTDYFEIRYEDLRETKKYFYKYDGEGFRYELLEFIRMINRGQLENYLYSQKEMMSITSIIEQFDNGEALSIQ